MKRNAIQLRALRKLLIAPLLLGVLGAKAQFYISPANPTICPGQSTTLSVYQANPAVHYENLTISENAQSYTFAGSYPNSSYPATGITTYMGVPFNIPLGTPGTLDSWSADVAASSGGGTVALGMNMDCPKKVDVIYTLINSYWGIDSPGISSLQLLFTNGTTVNIPLTGGVDIRDYKNTIWMNSLNTGISTTQPSGITVTPYNVWNDPSNVYRRDMQKIELPPAYSNLALKRVTLIDAGNNEHQRAFIAGASVHVTDGGAIVWHAGSLFGPVIPSGPAPAYSITVSPSSTTTYYAVSDAKTCVQSTTVSVGNCYCATLTGLSMCTDPIVNPFQYTITPSFSTPNGATYRMDFGDGSPLFIGYVGVTTPPVHTYGPGSYIISIVVNSADPDNWDLICDQRNIEICVSNDGAKPAPANTGNVIQKAGTLIGEPYPNPAQTAINVPVQASQDAVEVSIVSQDGKVLDSKQSSMKENGIIEMNTTKLAPGVYFINIIDGQGKRTKIFTRL